MESTVLLALKCQVVLYAWMSKSIQKLFGWSFQLAVTVIQQLNIALRIEMYVITEM